MVVVTSVRVTSRTSSVPARSLNQVGASVVAGAPSAGSGYQVSRTVPSLVVVARPWPHAVFVIGVTISGLVLVVSAVACSV